MWTPQDYAQLTTLYQSLVNREITRGGAFPDDSAADTLAALQSQASEPEPEPEGDGEPQGQLIPGG